jgi:hypothetical protein
MVYGDVRPNAVESIYITGRSIVSEEAQAVQLIDRHERRLHIGVVVCYHGPVVTIEGDTCIPIHVAIGYRNPAGKRPAA